MKNNMPKSKKPSRKLLSARAEEHSAPSLQDIGTIEKQGIRQEMEDAYLDYAMSVIVARALPDVRDGLKPVHRRVLFSMWHNGLRAGAKFKKCAAVVGDVM